MVDERVEADQPSHKASGMRASIHRALTGDASADVTGRGGVRGMLAAIGGRSARTKSGIDLTAAANELGVNRRTVERWVAAEQAGAGRRPRPDNMKNLQKTAQRQATTKAGRRRAVDQAKQRLGKAGGSVISVQGYMGPRFEDATYYRNRSVDTMALSPETADWVMQGYVDDGDRGFADRWEAVMSEGGYPDFRVSDVDSISWTRP